MKSKKVDFLKLYILLVLLATVITAGIDLYSYDDVNYGTLYIQRQFGNEIKLNILFIVILIGFFISTLKRKKRKDKSAMKWLLIFSTISMIFFNGKDVHLSVIGLVTIVKYYLLYINLTRIYKIDNYKVNLRKTFILILMIETIGGSLQTFFNISIPFLTSRNVASYRGDVLRMTGTFLFSADFALFITFITVFFICDYYFNKDKKALKYIILCVFDLWFSGSRTMIIVIGIIFVYNFLKRYQNKPLYKFILIIGMALMIIIFTNTQTFIKYFISDSFLMMFSTRAIHWKMGIEIITQHPFLGVGLNNSVRYVNVFNNIVSDAYTISLEPMSFYYTNPIHNSILIMLVELGVIGGLLYLLVIIEPIIYAIRKKLPGDKQDLYFLISEGIVLIVYAMQGWGSLREHGMVLMVIYYSYYMLMKNSKKTRKSY